MLNLTIPSGRPSSLGPAKPPALPPAPVEAPNIAPALSGSPAIPPAQPPTLPAALSAPAPAPAAADLAPAMQKVTMVAPAPAPQPSTAVLTVVLQLAGAELIPFQDEYQQQLMQVSRNIVINAYPGSTVTVGTAVALSAAAPAPAFSISRRLLSSPDRRGSRVLLQGTAGVQVPVIIQAPRSTVPRVQQTLQGAINSGLYLLSLQAAGMPVQAISAVSGLAPTATSPSSNAVAPISGGPSQPPATGSGGFPPAAIAGVAAGLVVAILVAGAVVVLVRRRRRRRQEPTQKPGQVGATGAFSLVDFFNSSQFGSHPPSSATSSIMPHSPGKGKHVASPIALPKQFLISVDAIKLCKDSATGMLVVLGEGGQGKVYKGVLHRVQDVAIKVVSNNSTSSQARFLREISVTASLRNSNIVPFCGACLYADSVALVMDYMPRGDLFRALAVDHDRQFGWYRRGHKIALGIAKGLVYLHSQDPPILHLDLKSPNVLLDDAYNAKIADVGISKELHGDFTIATSMGTSHWASPEQALHEHVNTASDVYSFGVVLWEICTGERPVIGKRRPLRPEGTQLRPKQTPDCPLEMFQMFIVCGQRSADSGVHQI
ncbi:hypothetical protein WJX72_002546 [[Myrmecia] bisecta]|uniref:non-specific serine/threonine protein kinase n=1 Tax=[Myrmecia] bisecta TaxID=41462 RepID=A0AAW1QQD6_9CHLO